MIKIILDGMWAYTKATAVIGVGAFIIVFGVVGLFDMIGLSDKEKD